MLKPVPCRKQKDHGWGLSVSILLKDLHCGKEWPVIFFQSSLTDFAIVANTCLQTAATHFSEPPAESFLHRAAPVTPPAFENGTGASKWEPTPFGAPLSGFDVG